VARRVTSKDIAIAAGVSRTAVSLVLNGRADGEIDREKQARIRRIAAQLGYVPNAAAVSLQRRSSATIGLITDEIASSPFAGPLIEGATTVAMRSGFMVLTIDTSVHDDYITGAVQALRTRGVDGLIFAAASYREVDITGEARQLPLVFANAADAQRAAPSFVPDDRGGSLAAVRLAIEAGHRRISYIAGDESAPATAERRLGYVAGLEEAGLDPASNPVEAARYTLGSHYEVAMRLLRSPDRPTAIVCANDRGAAGVLLAASSLGLTVPGDLSVVGFDDEQFFADDTALDLTTVALPHREMGESAIAELLRRIDESDPGAAPAASSARHEPVLVACRPVLRGSLAGPPRELRPVRD
jgi:LacI family transcriptional regulator